MTMNVRMRSGYANVLALALLGGIVLGITGCGELSTDHSAPSSPPPPASPNTDSSSSVKDQAPRTSVVVYEMPHTPSQVKAADPSGLIPQPVSIAAKTSDPLRQAATDLTTSANSPLPRGTTLRSVDLDKDTGLATIDFSREFQANFPGGDEREAQIINAVLATLGQFPDVQNVQFLVEGKKIGSLGGTQDLTDPLPAIRPGQMSDHKASGTPQPVASNP